MSVPTDESVHWGKGLVQHQFDWKCASVYEKKFVRPIDEASQKKSALQNLTVPTDTGCGETDGRGFIAAKAAEDREMNRKRSVKGNNSSCLLL